MAPKKQPTQKQEVAPARERLTLRVVPEVKEALVRLCGRIAEQTGQATCPSKAMELLMTPGSGAIAELDAILNGAARY